MKPTPNPRPHEPAHTPENAGQLRRLHCARYDNCLDVAIRERWPGFSCGACEVREGKADLPLRLRLYTLADLD
jgi:hypothetical protein